MQTLVHFYNQQVCWSSILHFNPAPPTTYCYIGIYIYMYVYIGPGFQISLT